MISEWPEWPKWKYSYSKSSYDLWALICTLGNRWWKIESNYVAGSQYIKIALYCRESDPATYSSLLHGGWKPIKIIYGSYTVALAFKNDAMNRLESYLMEDVL